MDSGESSLFWDLLLGFLSPLFYVPILSWRCEPIPSSNTCEAASYFFCEVAILATSARDELKKTPYFGRKLSDCQESATLFHLCLKDGYLRASYCECRKGTSIDQEVNIEEVPITDPSLNGYFRYEPDHNAVVAFTPRRLFNSSISMPASKRSFMKTVSAPPRGSKSFRDYILEDVLHLLWHVDLSPNMREALRETEEELRPIWNLSHRAMLPDLMVIDCISRRVVHAQPGRDYVALSYVWGSNRSRDVEDFQLDLHGRRLPQTVQDAMNVVCELGMQFLWVDRYCINSAEPVTKHYMISNMDAIYEAAYLTIIAASGCDDEHGLPSVSKSSKELGRGYIPPWIGSACTKIEPHYDQIKQSPWSTRGWTYQEGLLSRRRLIFTDDCAILHYRTHDQFKRSNGIFFHINEYSKRTLTYPSDLLNAFLGVLRAYERLRPPSMHLWGVPFLLGSDGNIRQPGYGLLWRAYRGHSLCRIHGLPSWTWAGWNGWSSRDAAEECADDGWYTDRTGSFRSGPYSWLLSQVKFRVETQPLGPSDISLDILTGEHLTDISDHFRAAHRLPFGIGGEPAPILYLTAWSTTVTGYVRPDFSVYLEGGEMGIARATFDSTVESLCKPESQVNGCWSCEWTAAVICWNRSNENARSPQTQCLLLERVGEDTFHRVGILETDWQKSDLDEQGRMAALGRNFARTRLCIA